MKKVLLLVLIVSVFQVKAQSVYNQKWKESTFFNVPHSYSKRVINENEVIYESEDEVAKLEIKEWPLSRKAENLESLKNSAKKIATLHDYSDQEIISSESLIDDDSNFIAFRLKLRKKKTTAFMTVLYSSKTDKNYVVIVEANAKYFKNNLALVERLSNGLVEY